MPAGLEGIPTVVVNAQDRAGLVPSVFPDEERGGYTATRHLIEAGHTRIAMINIQPPESDLPAGIGRLAGYRRASPKPGIAEDPRLVRYGSGIVEDGFALTLRAARARPTGRPRSSAETTERPGARTVPSSPLGLRVPEDCSIVGFDNHDMVAPYPRPGPDHRRAARTSRWPARPSSILLTALREAHPDTPSNAH